MRLRYALAALVVAASFEVTAANFRHEDEDSEPMPGPVLFIGGLIVGYALGLDRGAKKHD